MSDLCYIIFTNHFQIIFFIPNNFFISKNKIEWLKQPLQTMGQISIQQIFKERIHKRKRKSNMLCYYFSFTNQRYCFKHIPKITVISSQVSVLGFFFLNNFANYGHYIYKPIVLLYKIGNANKSKICVYYFLPTRSKRTTFMSQTF